MARELHSDHKAAKNKLHDSQAWLVLYQIHVTPTQVLRLVNNEEPITYANEVYSPFPIALEQIEETSSGDLPFTTVTVANVDKTISSYLEQHGGLLDQEVVIRIVHQSNLTNAVLESNFTIREVSATEESVSFRLSQHPFLEIELPHQTYYRHRCRWAFAGTECGWQSSQGGNATSCDKTLDGPNGCAAHNNKARFGGIPGIPRRRV